MKTAAKDVPLEAADGLEEQRFVLDGVGWDFYDKFLKMLGDRPVRVTYSQGTIELMSPSPIHEVYAYFIGMFISMISLELDIPVKAGGRSTFRRKDKDRGLEPDNCYWIKNALRIRSRKNFDLSRDPPPDLAVEIDITTSFLDRIAIYAALKISEVWCFDGESLRSYQLNRLGRYELKKKSLAFPFLPLSELVPFLLDADEEEDNVLVRKFLRWVKSRLVSLYKARNGA